MARVTTRFCLLIGVAIAAAGAHSLWAGGAGMTVPPERTVTPAQLWQMLQNKDFFLVRVIPSETEIPHTDAYVGYMDTKSRLTEFPQDRTVRIIVYCRSGRTSALALQVLLDSGFSNAQMLEGGMNAWEKAGLPLVKPNATPQGPYPAASAQPSAPPPEPCPCGLR